MTTILNSEIVTYASFDGTRTYNPATEGLFLPVFKEGVMKQDLYLAPYPSNTFVQLGNGFVGMAQRTMDLAQREFCAYCLLYPDKAHLIEIVKAPFAFAHRSSMRFVTDEPDPRVMAMAKEVLASGQGNWERVYYLTREQYYKAEGKYK